MKSGVVKSAYANLELLNLERCSEIVEDMDIGSLKNFKVLKLRFCRITKLIGDVSVLLKLEKIDASSCTNLEEIPSNIRELPSLKVLKLTSQTNCQLENLPDLYNLKHLMELRLLCPELHEIPGLGELNSLVTLIISDGRSLSNLDGLDKLVSLAYFTMNGCAIEKLPNLGSLKNLQALSIWQCPNLKEIQGLSESLQELGIDDCPSLERIPDVSRLARLRFERRIGLMKRKEEFE
ncbi:Probable disease resistance protein RPP1 [Linum perenne]